MFKNGDVVICTNEMKLKILKELFEQKKIINIKFYTLEQFKKICFGNYNEKSIYYLMKKYKYKYAVAKMYLNNIYGNLSLKKELEENNLITKETIKANKIFIYGNYFIDSYVMKEIEKYPHEFVNNSVNTYLHPVYELASLEDEVNFIIEKIINLLDRVELSDICLVNVGSEYLNTIKNMFNFYNIPISLKEKKQIYGTEVAEIFLDNLKKDGSIILGNDEISHKISEIVNRYRFTQIDEVIIDCIENEIRESYIEINQNSNAVQITDIKNMVGNKYYFILGFNEGVLPYVHKDEDFFSDKEKNNLGMLTSIQKNKLEKNVIKNVLTSFPNIIITYKNRYKSTIYYPSSLINELDLDIIKVKVNNYNSDNYNKLLLGKKIDRLIKYNECDNDLSLLFSNYKDIPYMKYDNQFTGIALDKLYNHLDNKVILSYSSMDNFYRCGFRYYIKNILKLDIFEETFMVFIGNLFHYVLSKIYELDFDFEKEFNLYIKERVFTEKEKFFLNKLKKDLIFTIDIIKKQDKNSQLNESLLEEKIYINHDKNIKITFMGIIDKIKYQEKNDKIYAAIIDYKTGNPEINLNYSIYGIDMQLPVYLYLLKYSKLKNTIVTGFYLQKIVAKKLPYQENENYEELLEKEYRLEGYSSNDESLVELIDNNYIDSKVIKGMKITSKGFHAYSKVLDNEKIDQLITLVEEKIDKACTQIENAKFHINPKKIGMELVGCKYCKYRDLCFMKEKDIVKLEEISFESR